MCIRRWLWDCNSTWPLRRLTQLIRLTQERYHGQSIEVDLVPVMTDNTCDTQVLFSFSPRNHYTGVATLEKLRMACGPSESESDLVELAG